MDVLKVNYSSPNAGAQFVKSMRETGFAVLEGHPIPYRLASEVFAEWAAFFQNPNKINYLHDPMSTEQENAGFFPYLSENAKGQDIKDLKEFYHYYPWQPLPIEVTQKTHELYEQLEKIGCEILGWMEAAVPEGIRANFDRPLSDMVRRARGTLLRILHYPPLTGDEQPGAVRSNAHGDINFITLLMAATQAGLEVQDLTGRWHAVPSDPGTIVVNGADMLEMLTQGFYPSTTHRVVNPVGDASTKPRYSIPLFLHSHGDVRLSREHTRDTYFEERLVQIGLRAKKEDRDALHGAKQ